MPVRPTETNRLPPLLGSDGVSHAGSMGKSRRPAVPRDRQPWDPANGLRIGIVVGVLVGAGLMALTDLTSFWVIATGGAIGGGIGYWTEKRRQQPPQAQ